MNTNCRCTHAGELHGDFEYPDGIHSCSHRNAQGELDCQCTGYARFPMSGGYGEGATCTHGVHPYDCENGCDPHTPENYGDASL